MASTLKALFMLVVATFTLPLVISSSRASYGDPCSKENRCESRKFLACSNSTCDCLMPDSMIYDDFTSACVTLAGERCEFSTVEGERTWTDQVSCVASAACTNGVCNCLPDYYEVSNGTCVRKGGFGAMCTADAMCNDKEHLVCGSDSSCVCALGRVHIEDGGHTCMILAGRACDARNDATCVPGAFCTTHKCKCSSAYFESNGLCKRKGFKGDSCGADDECVSQIGSLPALLVCSEGICVCNKTIALDAGLFGRPCAKKLGQLCNPGECLQGAECRNEACNCARTHFQTDRQTCQVRRNNGDSCRRGGECVSGLGCIEGKCACPSGKSFDHDRQQCVISAGSVCREAHSSMVSSCVPNARCDGESYYSYSTPRLCQCDSDTDKSKNGDGYCYANLQRSCNGDLSGPYSSKRCRPGLVCREGVCRCENRGLTYNSTAEKCQSYLGGPCASEDECAASVASSECSGKSGQMMCQCKPGFVQVDQECQVAFGGKCNFTLAGNAKCDKAGGLECNSRGICECPGGQEYDTEVLKCLGLVGTKCGQGSPNIVVNCTKGAECRPLRGFQNNLSVCSCSRGFQFGAGRKCYALGEPLATFNSTRKNDDL